MILTFLQKNTRGIFLLLSTLLGLATGYFCAVLLGLLLQPGAPEPVRQPTRVTRPARKPVLNDYQAILQRNIFNSAGGKLSFAPSTPTRGAVTTTTSAGSNWTLVGTVSGGSKQLAALAGNGKTRTYRLGARLPGGARLTKIERSRVTLTLAGGRQQILELPKKSAASRPRARTSAVRAANRRPGGKQDYAVRSLGNNRWQIPRGAAEKARSNIGNLLKQARVEPYVVNGSTEGFVIKMIKPGSLFNQIGLRVGDVLHEINGVPLDSPEKALQVFQQLRQARQINVSLERRGNPMTFSYEID